ncbi:host-nuclease inhibitor Gam family protein [Metabacillus idriensis]|uniref:host-nuclease inhibitor Gam family protein n=1 Tax=Metabacillus idriensis TaxID=324768 RepID=UPI0017488403|nr:host-nuclease inhibitor Gam family protein [Metabacillus idriensis]
MTFPERTLQEFLDDQVEVNSSGFAIKNEEDADWALQKIRSFKEKKEKNIATANSQIAKINAWLEEVNGISDRDIEHFQNLLAFYGQKLRDQDPKFKTLKLPNGKITFRKQQPKWEYDNDKILKWLNESDCKDLIRIKEEPDKSAIKKRFVVKGEFALNPDTGELVNGITITHPNDTFEVKVD